LLTVVRCFVFVFSCSSRKREEEPKNINVSREVREWGCKKINRW